MIDPALMNGEPNGFAMDYSHHGVDYPTPNGHDMRESADPKSHSASPTTDVVMTGYSEHLAKNENEEISSTKPEDVVSPVKLEADFENGNIAEALTPVSGNQPNFSPLTTISHNDLDTPVVNDEHVNGDTPVVRASRHSSRQPKHIERFVPENNKSPSKVHQKAEKNQRRASSSATSAHTIISTTKSRRSSSNTSATTHQVGMMAMKRPVSRDTSIRPVSRGSTVQESETDADERLARELQAAENGLRRRTSMRV